MRKYYTPRSPFSDQPDFESVLTREGTIIDAWRDYAGKAARPYSFETFRWLYKQWYSSQGLSRDQPFTKPVPVQLASGEEFVASETYWRSRSNPKAKILALRTGAALRVKNGALEITETLPQHLADHEQPSVIILTSREARRRHTLSSRMGPKTIVLPEHGWYLTAEAVKFCLANRIALISVSGRTAQGEKGLMTVISGDAQSKAHLVRAQVLANPIDVASEVVRNKLETCVAMGKTSPSEMRRYSGLIQKAKNVGQLLLIEAAAASAYWHSQRCAVRSSSRRWPTDWRSFSVRKSWIGSHTPQHADHPVNALLNWSYAVAAGRLATELLARGACLSIGYLHADKPKRYSLVYDALEVLRPLIDEKVLSFVGGTVFRMGDFQVTPSGKFLGEVRISPELLKVFGPASYLAAGDVTNAAEWMVETILAAVPL